MEKSIRIDSHKLIYHPEVVAKWLRGEMVYPIEIEISPSGACNHRCKFCALDYLGYRPNYLSKDVVLRNVKAIVPKGLKSVICAGEGEPLLNKDMPDIANGIKACGVDVAMSTNGVLFTEEKIRECLAAFTWVRYSIASFEQGSYDEIQRGKQGDLQRVKINLAAAVKEKRSRGLKTTLGVQCLLLPENASQLANMARELREIGVDYFTIKPFMQNLHSGHSLSVDYKQMKDLEQDLQKLETPNFSILFRANAMTKVSGAKTYSKCLGLPFMAHIDAKGNVWPCVSHIGDENYLYGNINDNSFEEIWEGERRKRVVAALYEQNINMICQTTCRLDETNKYLDELSNPGPHVNFI